MSKKASESERYDRKRKMEREAEVEKRKNNMPRKKPELNSREKAILRFIEKQIMTQGYPPSVREIGKAVGLSSTATVHGYLSKLDEKGYIKKQDKKGRTLRLLKGRTGEPKKNI